MTLPEGLPCPLACHLGVEHPPCDPDTPQVRAWQQAHAVALAVRTRLLTATRNTTSIWIRQDPSDRRWLARNGVELARLVLQVTGDEDTE